MLRKSLFSLALGTFALGISEFTMMGILSVVAADMGVSIPRAGDFISVYSLGVAAGAPCLLFMSRFPMRKVLLFLCGMIALGNFMVALAEGYASLLLGRFISGLPHGAYFGVAAIMATRLVGYGEKATAVAIMVTGMTVANVIGVPMATMLTNMCSWRVAFFIVSASGVLAFLGIRFNVPEIAPIGKKGKGSIKSQFMFLKSRAPWLIFMSTFLGQGSLYCWYSYVEPIMLNVAGFPLHYITLIMGLAGMGMVFGGLASGRLADRFKPGLVCGIICLLMIPVLLLIYFDSHNKILALTLTFIGAAGIFAIGGPLQYLIVRFSPGGEMLGGAGIQIAFNVSNAFSAWLGGCVIDAGFGYTSPALAGLPMAFMAALLLFYFNHRYKVDE